MPKRATGTPSNASPKKSKRNTPSPAKLTRSNSKKTDDLDPPEDYSLEQLSSEGEGQAKSDDEVDATAKSKENPSKKQFASLGYVVEEDLGEDNSQQGPYPMNGQVKEEVEQPLPPGRKRTTSKSSSAKREPNINPTLAVNKLKEEFFANVNQYYEQMLAEEPDEDDDELVVDISTVQTFRALYAKGPEEELNERKLLIDQLFREYLLDEVILKKKQWNLVLELSIKLAREEIASPPVPIALLTDLVELSNLTETVFQFIDARLHIWKESIFETCKTSVLRLCNELLRRLSREQDTILCGRILIFLSNYFPFSERSGLNVQSDFNLENVTAYKQSEKGDEDDPDDKMEVVEDRVETLFEGLEIQIPGLDQMVKLCQQESKKGIQVDYNLYVKFWSLQEFFRDPSKLYNKITWRTFATYTSDVLHAYKSYKLDESAVAAKKKKDESSKLLTANAYDIDPEEIRGKKFLTPEPVPGTSTSINVIPKVGDDTYFPKYLTNKRLLELQMGDPDFRRYFLVQLLIIIQYLTSKVKFKLETQVLNEEQNEYVKNTEEEAYQLLEQIPPKGAAFVHNLKQILKTEEHWNKWKNEGCQAFKKPSTLLGHPVDLNEEMFNEGGDNDPERPDEEGIEEGIKSIVKSTTRREIGDIIKESVEKNKHLLGNPELTRLWNICPDNLEACRSEGRNFMPTIDSFFSEAVKELEPGEPVVNTDSKKEIKPKKILGNASFGWRALRLLARQSPLFFQIHAGSPITPLQSYLEFILKKIITERESPPSTKPSDEIKTSTDADAGERKEDEDGGADNEIVQGTEEEDEINTPKGPSDDQNDKVETEEADGHNNNENRNLTPEEQIKLGKVLGADWKKLAAKLSFKKDEIDYFDTEHKNEKGGPGAWMLRIWTEQERDEASVADLLYILEGLGLKEKADTVIKC